MEIDQGDSHAYYNLGVAKVHLGEYQAAVSDFTKAIDIDPQHEWAHNNRGVAYLNLNDRTNACSDWSIAIERGRTEAAELISQFC